MKTTFNGHTIEYDSHLGKFTVLYEGDELVFDTMTAAMTFVEKL